MEREEEKQLNELKALPPAGGEFSVPNIQQFVSFINAITRVYKNPDEAVRHSRENARAMRRSLVIMEPLRARQMAVAQLAWHLEPEDNKDKEQLRVAKELTRIIEEIPDFLQYRMSLLEAVFFGRWAIQNRYRWDYSRGYRRLVIDGWLPVHGDTLTFKWDRPGEVGLFVNNWGTGEGMKDLSAEPADLARAHFLTAWEREAFVIHKHEIQAGDFYEPEVAGGIYGVGLRTYLYWPWHLMAEAHAWLTEYMERVGLGITIFYFESGNPQSEAAVRKAAEAQAFSNVILWPRPVGSERQGPMIERIEPNGAGLEGLLRIIQDYYGGMIKRYIIGQVLSSEVASSNVGQGQAEFQKDTFERIIKYDSENLGQTLTRDLVKVLLKYNYPDYPHPIRFKFNVDKPDPNEFLTAAREFYNLGGDIDSDELREVLGLSKPTKDSTVLRRSMTGLEEGQLMNAGSMNDQMQMMAGGQQTNGQAEGQSSDAPTKKIDAIKNAMNTLGVNAGAKDIMAHLQSQGLRVSKSLVYGVLERMRGPQYT